MKHLFLGTLLIAGTGYVHAVPVLNDSVATNSLFTVYPDHQDPNLNYYAPTSMTLAKDRKGTPLFRFMEFKECWNCPKRAIVQSVLTLRHDASKGLAAAQAVVRAHNPEARFAPLPFLDTQIDFGHILTPFVEASECNRAGGTVGSEQACVFRLTKLGRKAMLRMFRDGLTITFSYDYAIRGYIKLSDGNFEDTVQYHSVAGRIGGPELARYPQLFVDRKGRPIRINEALLTE